MDFIGAFMILFMGLFLILYAALTIAKILYFSYQLIFHPRKAFRSLLCILGFHVRKGDHGSQPMHCKYCEKWSHDLSELPVSGFKP